MSLEDRFRQAFDDAMAEVRTRLESQFTSTLTDVRAEADRDKADALADAKGRVESELLTAFQSEKAALTSDHDTVLAQLREAADTAAAAAKAESDQAVAEAARQREELEAALTEVRFDAATEVEKARNEAQEAATAHSHALDAQLTGAIRLLESVRALDGAASLTEVLDALTFAAAKEAGRSAMLVVKGERLIGWRTAGFGRLDDEPRSIESSTADVDALAAAVNTGRPALVGSGSVLAAPSFSQLSADRPGLAVPLLVAGRAVAVLYADTGAAAPLSPGWTSPIEVLVRHAGRCLEAMAVSRGAHARSAAARVGSPA